MSGLVINIKAGSTSSKSRVTATGRSINVIADSERASFGIGSDAELKRAVGRYFGKEPNFAYVKGPTPPHGDIYKTYGWSQVQRVLQPIRAEILEVNTTPTILTTSTLNNNSNKTATFSTNISAQVADTVSNEWWNSNKISLEQLINYKLGFLGTGAGGETKIGFEHAWGKNETVSRQTTATTGTGVSVDLKPGESAVVELSASSGKMRVRITFEAYLTEGVAVVYTPRYKGHHFWWLPIGGVIGSANKVQVVEDIGVGYYSNATVNVRNAKTNEEMMFHLADHPSELTSDDDPDESPSAIHPDEPESADLPVKHPSEDHSGEPASE